MASFTIDMNSEGETLDCSNPQCSEYFDEDGLEDSSKPTTNKNVRMIRCPGCGTTIFYDWFRLLAVEGPHVKVL